jgi:LysR family transcriptional regulator, carnitine catabolism transcriptional activator
MELRQLEYVVAIVDEGSFTAAARTSFVAQPSLSQAVRGLEEELGVELFRRVGRGVVVTPVGQAFADRARDVLRGVEELRSLARADEFLLSGRLDVVALQTLAVEPGAPLVGAFRRAHPGVAVRVVQPDGPRDLAEIVRSGRCEVGLTELPSGVPGLVELRLGTQDLDAVFPPRTALPRRDAITLDELVEHPIVTSPVGTSTRALLDEALSGAGLEAAMVVETDQREATVALVLAGAGATVLPRRMAEQATAMGAVRRKLRPRIRRRIGLVHRGSPLSAAGRAFVEVCRAARGDVLAT